MSKSFISLGLGVLAFLTALFSFGLLIGIPGLIIGILSLKAPDKEFTIPVGYKAKIGNKKTTVQPYFSQRYISYMAIALNSFAIFLGLLSLTSNLILMFALTG